MKEENEFKRVAYSLRAMCSSCRTILMAATAIAVLGLADAASVCAQSLAPPSAPPPAFEVASIKPSPDMSTAMREGKMPHVGMKVDTQRVDIGNFTMVQLISYAYKVKAYQISGPDWMKSAHWDIAATLPEGTTKEQIPEMMQALLAERFKLIAHRDRKEMPVLALEVGKNGMKMTPSPPDTPVIDAPNDKGTTTIDTREGKVQMKTTGKMGEGGTMQISGGAAGNVKMSVSNGVMHMESSKVTMEMLSQQLTALLGGQPVINQTGLEGNYVVAVDISMEDIAAIARSQGMVMPAAGLDGSSGNAGVVPTASDPSGGSIYTSIEKLGLKLNKQKLPVDIIVIDHLEKTPTDN